MWYKQSNHFISWMLCIYHTRLSREGNATPLQYSCLENPMDGGAWKAAVHGVAEGRTRLSDFAFTFHFHALEKEMAAHSSVLAWRIPGMGEPGELPSMGLHRVGHEWSDLAALACVVSCHRQTVTAWCLLHFGFLLFIFLLWLPWLGLPKLCWIKVARVDIFALFLILEEIFSAFHIWVWC